jgi:hypothetical protein
MTTAKRVWPWALGVVFVVLATANSAGYRYGASDQAFYIPAILRHVDPSLFPRDAALIDSQSRLTIVDDALGAVVRATGWTLPWLFVVLYVGTLVLLLGGAYRLSRHYVSSRWTFVALAAALTLRHAIARTGANTLEGYFHPRQLAFAVGVWALAGFLDGRTWLSGLLLAIAFAIHPTTALWFTAVIAAAEIARLRGGRTLIVATTAIIAAIWAAAFGLPASIVQRMDPAWLAVIADKDYLFPLHWPLSAWLTNLVTVPVILLGWRIRVRSRLTSAAETALVFGCMALAVGFAGWLPVDASAVALAVQLQAARVFWVLDFMAIVYLVWMLAEWPGSRRWRMSIAAVLLVAAAARGAWNLLVAFPDRALFAVHLEHADWRDAMAWARSTRTSSGWLADPMHAARYGSSLRAAGERDVLLERMKDSAIAMYDRGIAMRIADRERALALHPWDTADGARDLARTYDLDYLVIDRPLPLPEAHRAGSLFIYRLR